MSQFKAVCATAACLTGALLLTPAAQADTITLNLNSLPTGTLSGPITVDGFTITPAGSSATQIVSINGTNTLESTDSTFAGGTGDILTMVNGGSFSLDSVSLAALGGDTGFGIGVSNNVTGVGLSYGVHNRGTPTMAAR